MRNTKRLKTSSELGSGRKSVRIWLPPSPPPEMNDPRRSERLTGRVVETNEPVETEQRRLRSGSRWDSNELDLLGVDFHPSNAVICLPMLADDPEWTPSQRKGISYYHDQEWNR